jgi:hypothetical protein
MTDTLKEITAKVNRVLGTNFNTILLIDSTIEQDNHCVKSMWGENHAHECFATLQIWLLVP